MTDLWKLTSTIGQQITHNREFFPSEINTTVVSVLENNYQQHTITAIACTYERGLGSNPNTSITGSCGTGATAVGAALYSHLHLSDDYQIHVHAPGRELIFRKEGKLLFLS